MLMKIFPKLTDFHNNLIICTLVKKQSKFNNDITETPKMNFGNILVMRHPMTSVLTTK